ncbi:hypothetical protein KR51_00014140 [Rubidibacter lacunae KORDI 51-2]|uniref:Uncharacterized protein n=1 Tax=Rubidibacter lacunae KORDI 51-2 TaxID=582515 RepID=U5DC19_9CHRO|nr:hypothetical protein KR51_00014140 [Rubidibacter lacunae KORDI 51-2]
MRHSVVIKASLCLASAVAVTSLNALPGLAQSVLLAQRTERHEVIQVAPSGQQVQPTRRAPESPTGFPIGGPNLNNHNCPEGTVLIMWDKPIYDEEGLFVVGYEPTPICVDEDLEPAG